ncbi:MAG: cohesin domain-containing protein [Gammaproteobacteria bacterium]
MKKSFVLATCLLCSAVANAASVDFNPTPKIVNVGDSFSIDLEGHSFVDVLDGGGINLDFNPAIIHVTGVTINPLWEFSPSPGTIDNVGGHVSNIQFNSFASNPKGDFPIGSIQLSAVGMGASPLILREDVTNPFASGGSLVSVTLNPGMVQAVPEISEAWMMLVGLGIFGFARKMRWV